MIVGVIEHPGPRDGPVATRTLAVSGWVLAPAGLARLTLCCDDAASVDVAVGQLRRDVAESFPEQPAAARSGFLGLLDLQGLQPGRHRLTLEAGDSDGTAQRWHRDFVLVTRAAEYMAWRAAAAGRPRLPGGAALARDAARVLISVLVSVTDAGQAGDLWHSLHSIDDQQHRNVEVLLHWGLDPAQRPLARGVKAVAGSLADALRACTGQRITLLAAGERLLPNALDIVARNHLLHPQAGLLYADHEEDDGRGGRCPVLKPAWSPVLLEQTDYIGHPWFATPAALQAALDDASEQALLARIARHAGWVGHIPALLLARQDRTVARPVQAATTGTDAGITVVIPTRLSEPEVLARCLDGLAATRVNCPRLQVRVVLNNVADMPAALRFLSAWDVEPLHFEGPFNWSALNNAAAQQGEDELLLFMNDDVEALDAGWLGRMAWLALRPEVGAVGALLRYPDGRLQHAGVRISVAPQIDCRHGFRHCRGDEPELNRWLPFTREQTAVTGACLLTRREVFESLGGFDEQLALVFNDIDYGLRLAESGYASLLAGGAELVHHEGLSRGGLAEDDDVRRFAERWQGSLPADDPFYNPALKPLCDDWSLDLHARPAPVARLMPGFTAIREPMSTDQAWKQWGEQDPYYGVITDERYRARHMTDADRHAFFESGRMHVEHVLASCRRRLRPDFTPARVLDFGCGVGRLVVPFARSVAQVVGIDVSEGMLAEARRNCEREGLRNVTLLPSDDELSALEGSFDLIHASIVFQHIDVPRGRELFRRLLQRLAPQGLAVMHFTYAKQAHADTWGWPPETGPVMAGLRSLPKPRRLRSLLPFGPGTKAAAEPASAPRAAPDPEMQMNCYRLNDLFFMIQQAGAAGVHCEFTDHGGELGVVLYFERCA